MYVYSRLVFSWGFSVRPPGLSAGGPSLPVPPPSTLVGALSAGVARVLGWGEARVIRAARGSAVALSPAFELASRLLAAGAAVWGPVVLHRDVARYQTTPYQTPGNIRDPAQWFGAQNMGIAVAAGSTLEYVLVFDDSVLDVAGEDVLEAAAYGVARLGAKESLVHVEEARVGEARESRGGETCMYAPLELVEATGGDVAAVDAWDPRALEAYSRSDPFKLPPLRLAHPTGRPAPGVYLSPDECEPLKLKPDAPSYTGGWPSRLGAAAGLPGRP